jgi:galactokinase
MNETMNGRSHTLLDFHARQSGLKDDAKTKLFQAPGRVNLLGEHTDYSGGFCMPAALSFNTLVAATPRTDGMLRLHSMDADYGTAEISLAALRDPGVMPKGDDWTSYCFGVAWSLLDRGVALEGADLSLTGNVPQGAGLSSSASVEVAVATALLGLAGVSIPGPQKALLCQRAENVYVGAPCGIMDQFISANGVRDNALAIDTRALTSELAPIPESLRLIVCNSMVKHSVAGADGPYATVRRQVEEAANALNKRNAVIQQLRDATLDDLYAGKADMSEVAFKRARHVISDSQRVLDGVAALRAGNLKRFGQLMTEAHASFRDDFGASCHECDILVEIATALPGCLGSRLTGGGFGGCTVSLVQADHAESFAAALREGYRTRTGVVADEFICEIADGAGAVED